MIALAFARLDAAEDPGILIHDAREAALAAARALEPRDGRPLWGVPFVVKDNIDVAGTPTTAACPDFSYFAERDPFVVARLLAAGRSASARPTSTSSPPGSWARARPIRCRATRSIPPACRTLDTISVFALTVSDAWAVFAVAEADAYSRPMPAPVVSPLPPRLRIAVPTRASLVTDGDDVQAAIFHETPTRLRTTGAEVVELPSTRSPACPTRAPESPSAPPHSGRASAKSPRRCIRSPGRSSRAGWS